VVPLLPKTAQHLKNYLDKFHPEDRRRKTDYVFYTHSGPQKRMSEDTVAHDAASVRGIVERGGRIRRLMPRECLRLQGFEEEQIDKILAITSDAQAYKQAGNSVTVNVIEAIGRRIRAVDEELREEDAAA